MDICKYCDFFPAAEDVSFRLSFGPLENGLAVPPWGIIFSDSLASAAKSFSGPGFQVLQSLGSKDTALQARALRLRPPAGWREQVWGKVPGQGEGVNPRQVLGRWWPDALWLLAPHQARVLIPSGVVGWGWT